MGKASRQKRAPVVVTETSEAPPAPAARHTALISAALVVLVLAVFGRTAFNGFIEFDDPSYVTQNPVVQRGLSVEGVKYAFTTVEPYYWQPLTWLSHELDVTLFGVRPGALHAAI